MSLAESLGDLLEHIASIARGIHQKLTYFLALGLCATFALIWQFYSSDSSLWINLVKCVPLAVPGLVWFFIWFVLGQLSDGPTMIAKLAQDEDGILMNLDELSLSEPSGFRSLLSTVREFRQQEGLEVIFETMSGVTLLINPVFALLSFLMFWGLVSIIFVTPIILLIF